MWGSKNVFGLDEKLPYLTKSHQRCWQACNGHWKFQDSVGTKYHYVLFTCTVNVLLLFCYGLTLNYVKIPIFW